METLGIEVILRLPPEGENLNKACASLENKTHVASITIWGTGMLEFIVLDLMSKEEVIVEDKELESISGMKLELDNCLKKFLSLQS
jgi:hypothetical protein